MSSHFASAGIEVPAEVVSTRGDSAAPASTTALLVRALAVGRDPQARKGHWLKGDFSVIHTSPPQELAGIVQEVPSNMGCEDDLGAGEVRVAHEHVHQRGRSQRRMEARIELVNAQHLPSRKASLAGFDRLPTR